MEGNVSDCELNDIWKRIHQWLREEPRKRSASLATRASEQVSLNSRVASSRRHRLRHVREPAAPETLKTERKNSKPDDVIDLGAPRLLRKAPGARRAPYLPNPRLYPGSPRIDPRCPAEPRGGELRGHRRKRVFKRATPNARLYRPPPPRPPLPSRKPPAAWPPPAPPARLDTASHVALRLTERSAPSQLPDILSSPDLELSPRLVVTVPGAIDKPPLHHSVNRLLRSISLDTESDESSAIAALRENISTDSSTMEAGNRHSTSPEDCSEGNETLSAPSEFLAEFLSAIMRRQYAEALKYCRLILQYEPHNATARGFYPLLQHKVQHKQTEGEWPRDSSSEEASAPASDKSRTPAPPSTHHEMMEQESDESDASEECRESSRSGESCGSQSSLELDSSDALSLSRRTEHTDSASAGAWDSAGGAWDSAGGAGDSAGCAGDSAGSASRSDADDNGNAPAPSAPPAPGSPLSADLQNDNHSSASLRRLRAHFACSIK